MYLGKEACSLCDVEPLSPSHYNSPQDVQNDFRHVGTKMFPSVTDSKNH
jgi:hypothetical protein